MLKQTYEVSEKVTCIGPVCAQHRNRRTRMRGKSRDA